MKEEAFRRDPTLGEDALDQWHTLSLARHIGLSTARAGRGGTTTQAVLEGCERRLAGAGVLPGARRFVSVAALGGVLLGALLQGSSPVEAQVRQEFNGGAALASVYDSNVNRDAVDPRGLAGVVLTGIFRYRARGETDLRAEYNVGLHRYAEETPWNRVSHKLRVDGRRPAGGTATWGMVGELQLKGSGEDRTLGDQLLLEPSFRFTPLPGTAVRLRGISRFRRAAGGGHREQSHSLAADGAWTVGRGTAVELDLRYEVNRSETGRRDFSGPRIEGGFTRALSERDELHLAVEYRTRAYRSRVVDTGEGEALRRDDRWTPTVEWRRDLGGRVGMKLEYEYERRGSNDPDRRFGTHNIILGVDRIW